MEFVVRVLLYFTCLCVQDLVFCEDYAEMGGLITFSPSIRGKPVEILWKHNGDKVVEYDNSEMEQFGSFKDRVVMDFETGQLTIKKLSSQDSGQYESDITINGKVQSSRHNLTVLDVLPDPRVTCEVNETSNLQELLCSVDYKTPLQYKWSGPNVIDHVGVKLIIDEQQKNSDSVYSCTVKNEVSSKTADFNLQDCVTGAAAMLNVILPVLFAIILLISLIILAICIYKKKKSMESELKKSDAENALSEATLPSQMRLKYQNDCDKIEYKDKGSGSPGENEEKATLLNHSGTEEELYNNKNSLHAVVVEEKASSKLNQTQTEKHQEGQDEEEEGERDELENGNEMGKTSHKHLNKIDDADNNENNGKIPGEKKEQEQKDQQSTASSEAIFPNQTGLMHQNGSDKIQDEDNRSDNTNEEKATLLKDSGHEEQRYRNDSLHTDVVEEHANSKPEETPNQKLHESQEEEEKGEREKLGNGNEKMSVDELTEILQGLNIHHTDSNDKPSEEKIKEGNKEQEDRQSTATQEISTAQWYPYGQKEETQKPEKRNESGDTSAQQRNEGEVTARNEDPQTTGANTQVEDHKSLSCEPKQEGVKQRNDPPDAAINKLLNDNEVKKPDLDQRKDDQSVPQDDKHETQSNNFQPQEHQSKQNSTERDHELQHEDISDTDSDL